ncbi:hypothetical protein CUMW_241150 [Citrus unshiu]|uniref:Uncharacterized protein n=1 Tax=Citrus unshiu TaxID=55188 RepID=A0A2H5QMH8_CITUN|nr:hypothetical protein CUMW_241150 [Citrus unshiu]
MGLVVLPWLLIGTKKVAKLDLEKVPKLRGSIPFMLETSASLRHITISTTVSIGEIPVKLNCSGLKHLMINRPKLFFGLNAYQFVSLL